MVQTCAIRGCKSNSRRTEGIHFSQFPSEKNLAIRKQWIQTTGRVNPDGTPWEPKYFHKVCSKHFKDGRPTPENPVPELELEQEELPQPRRGRPPRSHSSPVPSGSRSTPGTPKSTPATSDSESIKESAKDPETASVKMDTNEDSNSSTPSQTARGMVGAKGGTEKSPPADVVPPRSSGRKRKKKVLPDALSDEEVIDQVIDHEPETFVIWRSRAVAAPSEATPESSAPSGMKSMRMRPRRVPSTPQPPEEPEPELPHPPSKRKRFMMITDDGEEEEKDAFCWLCHKDGSDLGCELCPRGFHLRCLDINQACPSWVCPECEKVMRAECVDTRSPAMSLLTIDQLCVILRFTCSQMRISGSEPFSQPVDPVALPLYADFIANPIDFATLERNIRRRMYGSTEAFMADVRWILHNSIVFNGSNNKLTGMARGIVRICKQEISDIEGCPDCYSNAWIKQDKNWFIKPCRIPHTLVWAKLKGYPFWPGKAITEESGQTDVRFFGAHDRAWVPTTNVFLLSREPPVEMKNRRIGLEEAMDELNIHIKKLKDKFGSFKYAAANIPYDPNATSSHIGRGAGGELKSETKKELGVPSKSETKADTDPETKPKLSPDKSLATRGSRRLSKGGVDSVADSASASEVSSNTDTLDRAETPMEDSKSEVLGTDIVLTPSKRSQKKGATDGTPTKGVDLSSVQKQDSRGVFEASDEAMGPDVTSIQRKKVKEERIIRTRASDKSIVDRLQEKIALAKRERSVSEESGASMANSTGADDEKLTSPELLPEDPVNTLTRKSSTSPIAKSGGSSEERELSPPVLVPETGPHRSAEIEDKANNADTDTQSSVGTPKKNPLLANLVESCKAQLGITSQEDLKDETSTGVEMEEEDVTTSSSSPQTVASSSKSPVDAEDDDDDDEDDDDDDDDDEDDDDDDDEEDDDEDDDEEEEEEEDTDMEVDEDGAKKSEMDKEEQTVESENSSKAKYESGNNQKDELKPAQSIKVSSKEVEESSKETTKTESTEKDGKCDDKKTDGEELMDVDAEYTDSKPVKDTREKQKDNTNTNNKTDNVSNPEVEKPITDQTVKLQDNTELKPEKSLERVKLESLSPEKPFPSGLLEELSKPCPKGSDTKANLQELPSPPHISNLEAALLAPRATREGTPTLNQTRGHDLQRLQQPSEKELNGENTQPPKPSLGTPQKVVTDTENTGNNDLVSTTEVKVRNGANQLKSETTDLVSIAMADVSADTPPSDGTSSQDDKIPQYKTSKGSTRQEGPQPEDSVFNVEKYVEKAMKGVQSVFHDMFDDFISSDMGHKTSKHLKAELLRTKWHYDQALVEQQHNTDLMMAEMRMVLEHEQNVRVKKLIRLHEEERERTIEEVKRKQWCANCRKEAMFYCCWNTSYCDYPCQQKHWTKHMSHCTQTSQSQTASLTPHDTGQSVMSIDSLTTPIHHAAPTRNTDHGSRPETRGTKRPASEAIRAMPVNTPSGVQYLPSQIAGSGSGMAVQYLHSQLGGPTSPSPVALQQLIANQQGTTTTSPGGPIMYQIVPQQMSNIRIIQPSSTTPTTAPPPYSPPADQPVTRVSQ